MEYTGEHLIIGEVGNLFVLVALGFALLSSVAYFLAEQKNSNEWKQLGRLSFLVHSAAVIGMVSTLFMMIFNQYYE